jgi:hypothetical protein
MGASFPFQLRFLFASRPQLMGRVLGIVYRAISAHLIQKAGFTRKSAQTGAVTLIQRFGGALNLNVHFHMLFLEGIYTTTPWGKSRFHRTNAPNQQELTELVHTISYRVAGFSLHAGVAAQAWERPKLERLCRYITRPAVSEKRLSLTPSGNIRYDVNGFTSVAGAWMRRSDPA